MRNKIAAIAGATIGWGGAGTLVFTGHTTQAVLAQAFLLSLGIVSVAWSMLSCRTRPMSASFEVGYEMGRRDAIREGSGAKVVLLRPDRLEGRRRVSV